MSRPSSDIQNFLDLLDRHDRGECSQIEVARARPRPTRALHMADHARRPAVDAPAAPRAATVVPRTPTVARAPGSSGRPRSRRSSNGARAPGRSDDPSEEPDLARGRATAELLAAMRDAVPSRTLLRDGDLVRILDEERLAGHIAHVGGGWRPTPAFLASEAGRGFIEMRPA